MSGLELRGNKKPIPKFPEHESAGKLKKNRIRLPGPPDGEQLLNLPLIRRSPFHGLTTVDRVAGRGVCVAEGKHEWAIAIELDLSRDGSLRLYSSVKCARCDADPWSR